MRSRQLVHKRATCRVKLLILIEGGVVGATGLEPVTPAV